ncbi:MAG: hypothetical protein KTR32_14635 [Granulosicoccus sp.]|nr:hypothetical protein [Granulosicoccus sp.]
MPGSQGTSVSHLNPVFALYGAMHGGGKTLTMMTPAGASHLVTVLSQCTDVHLVYYPGSLPLLVEQQEGGLDRALDACQATVLSKHDWDRQKLSLSDRIYR